MENTLQHHGILGMKWGVRRYQNKDGTLTAEGKARYGDSDGSSSENTISIDTSRAGRNQSVVRSSRTNDLDDEELKAAVRRLQLEKQYKDMMKETTVTQKSAGRKFVESVLNDAGKQVATEYTKKLMSAGLDKLLKEAKKETKS